MEQAFEELPGVNGAISGFTGGTLENPTYRGDHRGHYEAISVDYDPVKVSYERLLDLYWHNVDPFDDSGQFCDKGFSYRAAIFTAADSEQDLASTSLSRVQQKFPSEKVVTQILPAGKFWPVEEYHQDYYQKNPLRYRYYKGRCGRADRLEQLWGEK
jgi:peptide-methionine (S)-S-oxide reductase